MTYYLDSFMDVSSRSSCFDVLLAEGKKVEKHINQSIKYFNRFSPQALEVSFQLNSDQMNEIVELLRGKLFEQNCAALEAREALHVHARDVFAT